MFAQKSLFSSQQQMETQPARKGLMEMTDEEFHKIKAYVSENTLLGIPAESHYALSNTDFKGRAGEILATSFTEYDDVVLKKILDVLLEEFKGWKSTEKAKMKEIKAAEKAKKAQEREILKAQKAEERQKKKEEAERKKMEKSIAANRSFSVSNIKSHTPSPGSFSLAGSQKAMETSRPVSSAVKPSWLTGPVPMTTDIKPKRQKKAVVTEKEIRECPTLTKAALNSDNLSLAAIILDLAAMKLRESGK